MTNKGTNHFQRLQQLLKMQIGGEINCSFLSVIQQSKMIFVKSFCTRLHKDTSFHSI